MNNLKGRVLTYNDFFVNEDMLQEGIYSTNKPQIHWEENLTIDKYIEDTKFVSKTVGYEWPEQMYENIKKCEFKTVTLKVDQ